jgi:hypothetical protein
MNDLEKELYDKKHVIEEQQLKLKCIQDYIHTLEKEKDCIEQKMVFLYNIDLTKKEKESFATLLKHIITIINTDEVIGWSISLLNIDPSTNHEYDRGKYSIKIKNYTIEEYDNIGLRYSFQICSKHPKIREIISKVFNEIPVSVSIYELSWSMFLYETDITKKKKLEINENYLQSLFV